MPSLDEWTSRWEAIHRKLSDRLAEVHDEALAAFHDIAATAPFDVAPHAALESAVQARYLKLSSKLDAAMEALDRALEGLEDRADDEATRGKIDAFRDRAIRQQQALQVAIERAEQRCKVDGGVVIARAIEAAFQEEDPTQSCVQCGTPFDPGPLAQSTAVPCPGCGARLTVGPRPAASAWFSRGIGALAEAEAWPEWVTYRTAEAQYNDAPSPARLIAHVDAAEAYHRAVFAVLIARHPLWDQAKADRQIQGRCAQIRSLHDRFHR